MAATVEVVVLAHDHRETLEDLIDNIHFFVPEADISVFNGGTDASLTAGLGVGRCPYSCPIRLGNLVPFHSGVLRWISERDSRPDFHVLIDSDLLFMRAGFVEFLECTMSQSEFMAGGYLEVPPGYYPEWDEVRRMNYSWKRRWKSLFDLPHPSWGFNPGTVYRREFVDRVCRFDNTSQILEQGERSRIYGIEEFIFSTLARRLGCQPIRHPGSLGLVSGYPTRDVFERCFTDPAVFMIHKIGMDMHSPDRRMIRGVRDGRHLDFEALAPRALDDSMRMAEKRVGWRTGARERLKDLYFQVMP